MNNLYKTKKVLLGLNKHPSYSCKTCPYNDVEDCTSHLMEDASDVIAAQKEMMNRKEMAKDKPGFITLTSMADYPLAIRVSDISVILDSDHGSSIAIKDNNIVSVSVKEKIEEILAKIADMKGEEE